MHFVLRLVPLALLLACEVPEPMEPVPDAAVEPDCSLALDDVERSGRQGQRMQVPFTAGVDVTAVRLEQLVSLSDSVVDGVLRVTLPYQATSAKVVLAVDCAGATKTVDVDFTVSPLVWSRATEWTGAAGPTAREYFSMWLDPKNEDRLFVFGGFVYVPQQFTPSTELWSLDVTSGVWTAVAQSGAQPTLAGGRLAVDADGGALYFSGVDVSANATPYALTALVVDSNTATWTSAPAASGARGEYQPSFFFDAKRGRHLSVCGISDAVGYHCDVRELVGNAWRAVTTSGMPPIGRNGHAWVYDAKEDRLVIFGGDRQGSTLGDTWVLELSGATPTWVKLFDASVAAEARRNMAWALDTVNHRLLIWGGTPDGANAVAGVQALDLTRGDEHWSQVDVTGDVPPARASGAAVFDAKRGRLLMGFGNTIAGQYADLWSLQL